MAETPLETAKRVWPGDWESHGPDFITLDTSTAVTAFYVAAFRVDETWVVTGLSKVLARAHNLPTALERARIEMVRHIRALAKFVGLEVTNA